VSVVGGGDATIGMMAVGFGFLSESLQKITVWAGDTPMTQYDSTN